MPSSPRHDGPSYLAGVRPDQRAPVVTALAIISHLLRRYAPEPLIGLDDWRFALRAQLGDDALVLVNGPVDKPQFLQPVLTGLGTPQPLSITEVDHLFPAAAHPLKPRTEATLEEAVYALMTSSWRHHGGVGHYAGARARCLSVLVGDGVTIASEIASLAAAYDAMRPALVGTEGPAPSCARDHQLWMKPWRDEEPLARVPYPFIDAAAYASSPGRMASSALSLSPARAFAWTQGPETSKTRTCQSRQLEPPISSP